MEPNPAQGRGRGRGRPPSQSGSSRGRGRRGRSSYGSKGRGRGGAIVNDGSIGVAGTTPAAFESDGRRGEAAVSGGRGRGHSSGRFCKSPLPYRPTALQSQAEWEMKPLEEVCSIAQFGNQQEVIDFLLGDRCVNYVDNLQKNLGLKLSLHSMEGNEINLFHLLISSAFDSLLEYTNESLNEKRLIPLSYGEFRKFIGTLLLSSVFNTSAEQSWNLMGCLTANKHMCRERFVQVLSNLRGYDVTRRIISSSNSRWIDQRNIGEKILKDTSNFSLTPLTVA
jgi:hypothetical protein